MRQAIDRAMPELTLSEAKALLGVISIVSSWSRLEDSVSNKQLRAVTGMDESRVRKALHSLNDRGVFEHTRGDSAPGGGRKAGRVRLPTPVLTDPRSDEPGDTTTPGHTDDDPRSDRPTDPGPQIPASEDVVREPPEAIIVAAAQEIVATTDWYSLKSVLERYSDRLAELHANYPHAPAAHLAAMTSPGSPLLREYANGETDRAQVAS